MDLQTLALDWVCQVRGPHNEPANVLRLQH
jgi:hypothetical protein